MQQHDEGEDEAVVEYPDELHLYIERYCRTFDVGFDEAVVAILYAGAKALWLSDPAVRPFRSLNDES